MRLCVQQRIIEYHFDIMVMSYKTLSNWYEFFSIKYFGGYLTPPTVSKFLFTASLSANACVRLICHAIPEIDEICRRHLFRHEKYCLHTVHIDQIQINTILLIRFMCVAYKCQKSTTKDLYLIVQLVNRFQYSYKSYCSRLKKMRRYTFYRCRSAFTAHSFSNGFVMAFSTIIICLAKFFTFICFIFVVVTIGNLLFFFVAMNSDVTNATLICQPNGENITFALSIANLSLRQTNQQQKWCVSTLHSHVSNQFRSK